MHSKLCLKTLTSILIPANILNTDKVNVKLFKRTMKCLVKGIEPCSDYKMSYFTKLSIYPYKEHIWGGGESHRKNKTMVKLHTFYNTLLL